MLVVTQLATKVKNSGNREWFEGKDKELAFTPAKFEMSTAGLNETV